MPRTRSPSSPAYTSSASPSPRPDRLAPPVPTTSSTIFSGVEPGPPATDTAPDRHTRMPKSAAKRRQPRRLPPLTSPMKHRGESAGIRRTVVISIVGIDRMQDYGFYRAQLVHEDAARAHCPGPVVVRATQFHDFVGTMLQRDGERFKIGRASCRERGVLESVSL